MFDVEHADSAACKKAIFFIDRNSSLKVLQRYLCWHRVSIGALLYQVQTARPVTKLQTVNDGVH